MNSVLKPLEDVAILAVERMKVSMSATSDGQVEDRAGVRDGLAIVREYSRLYSAQTARAGVAVKLASALGLKKDQLLPVWNQLNG